MISSSPHPSTFAQDELNRALAEQSFGIVSYEIIAATQLEATARVVLLEDKAISVSLTSRGYAIITATPEKESKVGVTYESIEDLLQTASAMYGQARHKVLMDMLASLSSS